MKMAIITDASAFLKPEVANHEDVFVLDIPIVIDGESYSSKNLAVDHFYEKMAASQELPKTAQPFVAELESLLEDLKSRGYTDVLGLFLSSGISGFFQNAFYLQTAIDDLNVKFMDTLITSAPMGFMVETALNAKLGGQAFDDIVEKINQQISSVHAYIVVDDLNHLVKGGRLSGGAALLGTLLNIKPILEFDKEGKIVVYEKVRTQKKALKKLESILDEQTKDGDYQVFVIHSQAQELADELVDRAKDLGFNDVEVSQFGPVIGTHLGSGAVAYAMVIK
jgi:DegV family protein with EDD domain